MVSDKYTQMAFGNGLSIDADQNIQSGAWAWNGRWVHP